MPSEPDPTGRFEFTAEVWRWEGNAAWHFVSLPFEVSDDIEAAFGHRAAGFGSIKVEVRIGSSTWRTSLFPDTKRATYVLPVKKAVRTAERLEEGSSAEIELLVV
jgi:hypothetical protein